MPAIPQVLTAELAAAAQLLHYVPTAVSLRMQGCEAALVVVEDTGELSGHVRASPQHIRLVMLDPLGLQRPILLQAVLEMHACMRVPVSDVIGWRHATLGDVVLLAPLLC